MDFFSYVLERAVYFGIASVPLILTFLQLKVFKLSFKSIASCLVLNLLVSGFFWLKLKDIHIVLYQSVPYVVSFLWIWAESVLRKRTNDKSVKDLSDSNHSI